MFEFNRLKEFIFGDGTDTQNLNQFMRKKQNIMGFCLLFVLILATVVLFSLSKSKAGKKQPLKQVSVQAVDGVLSSDFMKKNELSALEQQQSEVDRLSEAIRDLKKKNEESRANQNVQKSELINEINAILAKRQSESERKGKFKNQTQIKSLTGSQEVAPFSNKRREMSNAAPAPGQLGQFQSIEFQYQKSSGMSVSDQMRRDEIARMRRWSSHIKTTRNYVPSGTFARGVLLEGADANASVKGQSNTVGILVRILDDGTLPNGRHSHLKGCFVLASIYGDISSERGEARLTRLSCTRSDGTILDQQVRGYLSFAGKEGIKGHPVMRNGKILAMAGISGMLSGIGSALQQSVQTQSISPLGATTTISPTQVWQNGIYGGANTAMSQLAHYYIQRADQYHPIIEIGSGTVATVIFQKGFSLIDKETNDQMSSSSSSRFSEQKSNSEEIKTLLSQAGDLSRSKLNIKGGQDEPFSNVN